MEISGHLPESSAIDFVTCLTMHSDLIVFSAAIKHQGCRNHINEQPQNYWIQKFNNLGYQAHQFLRDSLWKNDNIGAWYRQNIMCFSRTRATSNARCCDLEEEFKGFGPTDVVHPESFEHYAKSKAIKVSMNANEMVSTLNNE